MNTPYVKQYDKNGVLLNPIVGGYYHEFPNRAERRRAAHPKRFRGNHKGISLTVNQNVKYRRVMQVVFDKDTGKKKNILHYLTTHLP